MISASAPINVQQPWAQNRHVTQDVLVRRGLLRQTHKEQIGVSLQIFRNRRVVQLRERQNCASTAATALYGRGLANGVRKTTKKSTDLSDIFCALSFSRKIWTQLCLGKQEIRATEKPRYSCLFRLYSVSYSFYGSFDRQRQSNTQET